MSAPTMPATGRWTATRRVDQSPASRSRLRRVGRRLAQLLAVLLALGATTLVAFLGWLAVGDDADPEALAAALATHDVTLTDTDGVLTITSASDPAPDVAVAFLPGTRIERDAYVATWAPIVEATGVAVHVAAPPLNLPLLGGDAFDTIIDANPAVSTWIVGGHSMGGFEAVSFAASAAEPDGLLLWGSGLANTDLSDTDVPTLFVAGELDNVLPVDRVVDPDRLGEDTVVEVIDGMVHGQFGRYSDTEDPADPDRRSDADTLDDLVTTTTQFLERIVAGG